MYLYITTLRTGKKTKQYKKNFTKYETWATHGETTFKSKTYGTFISSHWFTYFHKKVLITASFDAKLSTDGSHGNDALWEAATC